MKEIIYQILPRLWGKGKFSSLDAGSLDYFRGLGIDSIWLTGVLRHATRKSDEGCAPSKVVKGFAGSPYAVTDCFDTNPYLAFNPDERLEEFSALLSRIHGKGMKVYMDFVPNHVAREYTGILGSGDDKSVHWKAENDFFYYPGEELRLPVDAHGYREYPAKASGNCFSSAPDINDWYETVKLNYCPFHTRTWDRMYDAVRFWAGKGVDGFRCDMVELVPPEFMKWLIAKIKDEFPAIVFIAEVYQKDRYRFYSREVGFDLLYDKSGLYDTLRSIVKDGSSAEEITWNWQFLGDLQEGMLNFLENHDEVRLASSAFAGSAENGLAALAVSLLLNNAPFMLYFGQETGEREERTSIFDFCKVSSLDNPDKTVLERYRETLMLSRRQAFSAGKTFDLGYCQGEGFDRSRHFAFLRSDGNETWLVVSNFGETADITVTIPQEAVSCLGVSLPERWSSKVGKMDFTAVRLSA